ncbi:hypothetical protein D9615_004303 [Tricholomella constricta]|uniref:LysM domain-containing protein n=1 Tax=Tricholomella constricta TaxID=117010 RepID=A0A8H5HEX6_9AGAR|nr:hypothetical protein D9615_004303 [Tricholomella constricta]
MPYPTPLLLTSVTKVDIDKNTTLCFACSSSLPPLKKFNSNSGISTSTTDISAGVFTTPCCQRLICPSCIARNPRLQRYNPCLACLGGVGVVRSPSGSIPRSGARLNIDGAARDEDMFVLGDDEDESNFDDEKEGLTVAQDVLSPGQSPPPAIIPHKAFQGDISTTAIESEIPTVEEDEQTPDGTEAESLPLKYHITRSDTLQGIVLRYGLDGHELCRLNNLPPSTLRTTPHLLHTRRFLILPPTVRKTEVPLNKETPEQAREREASRGKERAEKRLQTLMKEVDWRVAKAYVALADDAEEVEEWNRKRKESLGVGEGPSNLEGRAIRKYLDDDEWEERQRDQGFKAGSILNRTAKSEKDEPGDGWWRWGK